MLGHRYDNQTCSAARALELVGERWSLLILRDALFRGYTRFSDFQRSLGIAPNILAKRLESFVEAGIMEARPSAPGSEPVGYVLTPKGLDFKPTIIALTAWGDRWVTPGPAVFEHAGCGGVVEQQLRCAACGAVPGPADVRARAREAPNDERSGRAKAGQTSSVAGRTRSRRARG
jgi:DNA-binding HxlR family transcriptional regulator